MNRLQKITAASAIALALIPSSAPAEELYKIVARDSDSTNTVVDPAFLDITSAANVIGTTAVELAAQYPAGSESSGGVLLTYYTNNVGNFGIASANGVSIDNATEFTKGYTAFTIRAATGYSLDLSSLSFDVGRSGASGTTRGYTIYATVNDAPFTYVNSTGIYNVDHESGERGALRSETISLAGAGYQDLTSISFRIYAATDATNRGVEFNNITLNGTAVSDVPPIEPPVAAPFEILSVQVAANGHVTITWPVPAGVTDPLNLADMVQRSTTLEPDSWIDFPATGATITDGIVTYTDTDPPVGGKAFYRITR